MSNNKGLDYALSQDDIITLLKGKVKVITYKELSQYKNIEEALKIYGRLVLLFESRNNYGHWTLLHRLKGKKNEVEMFDSYGLFPDEELDYIPKDFKKQSTQANAY